jgi:hypothetical protein
LIRVSSAAGSRDQGEALGVLVMGVLGLQDGRITGLGAHAEVVATDGPYAALRH